jgi:ABC-2 type transport system ATP-binding protein
VVIIARGQIMYDGSLAGVVDSFSTHKVLTLQFADDRVPSDLSRFGELIEAVAPKVKIRVERADISRVLSSVLTDYSVEDVSVEDPPLEEVIAALFVESSERAEDNQREVVKA